MIAVIFNSLDILLFRSVIRYPADNCQRARNVLDFWRWFKFVTVALLIFHYFIALDRRRSQPIARIAHGSIPAIALDCTRSQSCSHIIAEDFDFTPAIDQAFKAEKHKHRLLNVILYWILFELSSLSSDRREAQILLGSFLVAIDIFYLSILLQKLLRFAVYWAATAYPASKNIYSVRKWSNWIKGPV